ncbi:MAG: hypothetical protein DRR42_16415 [Gammaproteobacteria bacterium]|nr:MAG: hypothetical protein DRR42_16415 [Gammaproteobacteria bacterium]
MSNEENKKTRAEKATDAMIKKVEKKLNLLQKWIEKGVPKDKATGEFAYFPDDATAFAEWENESLKIEKHVRTSWEKKVDNNRYGANKKNKLKKKQKEVFAALIEIQASTGKKGEKLTTLKVQLKLERSQVASFAAEISALHESLVNALEDKERWESRNEDLKEQNQKLVRQLKSQKGSLSLVDA